MSVLPHRLLVSFGLFVLGLLLAVAGTGPAPAAATGIDNLLVDAARTQPQGRNIAVKLTAKPYAVDDTDRAQLRHAGFSERDIWDIGAVAGFFNMSNRIASATDMRPNTVYHSQSR